MVQNVRRLLAKRGVNPDQVRPVSGPLVSGIALLPEGLGAEERQREVRRLVHRHLMRWDQRSVGGAVTVHDARVWVLIREVLLEG